MPSASNRTRRLCSACFTAYALESRVSAAREGQSAWRAWKRVHNTNLPHLLKRRMNLRLNSMSAMPASAAQAHLCQTACMHSDEMSTQCAEWCSGKTRNSEHVTRERQCVCWVGTSCTGCCDRKAARSSGPALSRPSVQAASVPSWNSCRPLRAAEQVAGRASE